MTRKDKHNVDGVIRSLSKKGVVITLDQPITKRVNRLEMPSQEVIDAKWAEFNKKHLLEIEKDILSIGAIEAAVKWQEDFRRRYVQLFSPRTVSDTVIAQHPFTVNIQQAVGLGNGSWGKIDFLLHHKGFVLMK